MTITISQIHQKRFEEIKKDLQALGYREGAFLKVQLLFFEALDISRTYGSDPEQNSLLAALKGVQQDQYEKTKAPTKKPGMREQQIRRFIVKLKNVLSGR